MEKFHGMFHGTDVYINGKYKYNSNGILTAYLNLDLDMKYLTDLHFYLRQAMKNLKLRTDYSDEERFVDYEKNVQWAQKLIDEVDTIRLALPPYNRIVAPQQMPKNKTAPPFIRFHRYAGREWYGNCNCETGRGR